jgi:RNA polymerase sigma-70 factor (ECF subfamily)
MQTITDEDLIKDVQLGNERAFEEIHTRYAKKVRAIIFQYAHPDDLDDLVQGIFLRVFERVHQYTGESKFITWLYRVAINHALDQWRTKQAREGDNWVSTDTVYDISKGSWIQGVDVGAIDPHMENIGDLAKMYEYIEVLPEHLRIVVRVRLMGEPYEVIAERYSKNISTVKSNYFRAVQMLRTMMLGDNYDQ